MKRKIKIFTAFSAALFIASQMMGQAYAAKSETKSVLNILKEDDPDVKLEDIDSDTLRKAGAEFQQYYIPLDQLDTDKYDIVQQSPDYLKEDGYVKAIHFYYDVYEKNGDRHGSQLYRARVDFVIETPSLCWWTEESHYNYGSDFDLLDIDKCESLPYMGGKFPINGIDDMEEYLRKCYDPNEGNSTSHTDIIDHSYNERTVFGQKGYLYADDGYNNFTGGRERSCQMTAFAILDDPLLPSPYRLRFHTHMDAKSDGSAQFDEADVEKLKQDFYSMIDGGGHWEDPVLLYASVPVEETTVTTTEKTTVTTTEAATEATTLLHKTKDTYAKKEKGEDDGISIPEIIVTGIGGAAAALILASGGPDGGDKNKRRSSFKMYLYKEFGDSIRRGSYSTAKTVYARMAEISYDGKETDRPDLTKGIDIFAGSANMSVADVSMSGNYKAAHVWAEEGTNENEGIVCFKYTGEGGTFTNRMHFAMIGAPAIEFPKLGAYTAVNVLFGDKLPTNVQFAPVNFEDPVEKIWLESNDPDFVPEYIIKDDGTAVAVVKNNSSKDVPPIGDYPKYARITVHAENKKEKAENSFGLDIYPQGISLAAKTEEGRVIVPTNIGSSVNIYTPELQATAFKLCAAYKAEDGSVIADEDDFAFSTLEPVDNVARNILDSKSFNYKLDPQYKQLIPLTTLLEKPEDRFLFGLKVKYNQNAQKFELDIPIRLTGEKLDPDKLAREEEKKKLKKIVEIVGLAPGGNAEAKIRSWDKIPTEKLHIVRWAVFLEGRSYYLNENTELVQVAKELDDVVNALETTKYFGDLAFSTLIRIKLGDMWEAVLTPTKDLIVAYTANYISAKFIWETDTPDFLDADAWLKCFMSMAENSIVAWVTDGITNFQGPGGKSLRTICMCIGGCLGLSYFRHYYYDSDPDIKYSEWGSLKAACKDLSLNLLKAFLIYMFVGGMKRNKVFSTALMRFSAVVAKDGEMLTASMLKAGVKTNVRLAEAVAYGTSDILYNLPAEFTSSMKNLFGHIGDMKSMSDKIKLDLDGKEWFIPIDVYLYVVVVKMIELFHIDELIDKLRSALDEKTLPENTTYIPPDEVENDLAKLKTHE